MDVANGRTALRDEWRVPTAARSFSGPARAEVWQPSPFKSWFLGGFECSSHRRPDGRRLDLLATTRHDRFVHQDYAALRPFGIKTVRDGLRWHLIETAPGHYDWSSLVPMLEAARRTGTQVIWDLCHYGWPDDLDIFAPAFVDRFARFAAAAALVVREHGDGTPFYCPINEISFFAWKAGDAAGFYPGARKRGDELKRQLARASIAAIEAIRAVDAHARFVQIDPMIHVHAGADTARSREQALNYTAAQFQAWDMLAGFAAPELGGRPDYLDIIGVNYYDDNQWSFGGSMVPLGHPQYRPMRDLLVDVHTRYRRPVLIAETGCEGEARAGWLRYVGSEVRAALFAGVPIQGICIYPISHYPGWTNNRVCECGLLGRADETGERPVDLEVAAELARQQAIFANGVDGMSGRART